MATVRPMTWDTASGSRVVLGPFRHSHLHAEILERSRRHANNACCGDLQQNHAINTSRATPFNDQCGIVQVFTVVRPADGDSHVLERGNALGLEDSHKSANGSANSRGTPDRRPRPRPVQATGIHESSASARHGDMGSSEVASRRLRYALARGVSIFRSVYFAFGQTRVKPGSGTRMAPDDLY